MSHIKAKLILIEVNACAPKKKCVEEEWRGKNYNRSASNDAIENCDSAIVLLSITLFLLFARRKDALTRRDV